MPVFQYICIMNCVLFNILKWQGWDHGGAESYYVQFKIFNFIIEKMFEKIKKLLIIKLLFLFTRAILKGTGIGVVGEGLRGGGRVLVQEIDREIGEEGRVLDLLTNGSLDPVLLIEKNLDPL